MAARKLHVSSEGITHNVNLNKQTSNRVVNAAYSGIKPSHPKKLFPDTCKQRTYMC